MALPLVLVPGLMNDARVWQRQRDHFATEREVHVADSASHATIRDIATRVLGHVPYPRFALAGFSLGGYVALELMRLAPERIAAFALVDTGSRADTPEATVMRRQMLAAVDQAADHFDAVIASFLPRVTHPSRVGESALVELFVAMAKAVGIAGFVRQQNAAITRIDSRETLKEIRCPALVFCGREDQITPLALSEEMAAMIPEAQLVIAETCGHMSPMERPAVLNDAMDAWLARVPTT